VGCSFDLAPEECRRRRKALFANICRSRRQRSILGRSVKSSTKATPSSRASANGASLSLTRATNSETAETLLTSDLSWANITIAVLDQVQRYRQRRASNVRGRTSRLTRLRFARITRTKRSSAIVWEESSGTRTVQTQQSIKTALCRSPYMMVASGRYGRTFART
jgi:hypothetical protein